MHQYHLIIRGTYYRLTNWLQPRRSLLGAHVLALAPAL